MYVFYKVFIRLSTRETKDKDMCSIQCMFIMARYFNGNANWCCGMRFVQFYWMCLAVWV